MTEAPIPKNEAARLDALRALRTLDTPAEERFDRITRTVARYFSVPMALVSLVDSNRQWFKARVGLGVAETPRSVSFCAHAILQDEVFVVEDATQDPTFADNALVTGPPHVRFYAGYPLRAAGGEKVGTLCILDRWPRSLQGDDRDALVDFAAWAQGELTNVELATALTTIGRSESELRLVMASVSDAIVTFDADGRIAYANPGAADLFGSTPEWFSERNIVELVSSQDQDEVVRRIHERVVEGRVGQVCLEVKGVRDGGDRFPMEVLVNDLGDSDTRFIAVARDISKRRADEQDLDRLRRRLASILSSAAEGIVGVDNEGRITFVNESATKALGYRRDQLLGAFLHDTVHQWRADGSPYPWDESPMRRTLVERLPHRVTDEVFWRANKTSFPVEYSSAPIIEDGTVVGAVVTFNDITERRAVERLKDEFVSVVSHELRTPLTSIRGSLGLLASGVFGGLEEQGGRMLDIAVANTDRLVRLVNDILDLERIASGRAVMEIADHDLADLADQALSAVTGAAERAEVTIDVHTGPTPVRADADRVVQVIVNLLGNAIKFSPPGSTVTMTTSRDDVGATIDVADRGRGIPPELQAKVFERFEQVDGSDAREKGGTGLGLAIAKNIVDQHGGKIWVDSSPGAGSTFHVTLPAPPRPAVTGDGRSGRGAGVVLVVEDDADIVSVLRSMLEPLDLRIVAASSQTAAAEAAAAAAPDVVVLDLNLAGGDGYGVLRTLRGDPNTLQTPVIVHTVDDLDATQRRDLENGPVEIIVKSRATIDELRDRILARLETTRTERR